MGLTVVALVAGLGIVATLFWLVQLLEAVRFAAQAVWLVSEGADPPRQGWPSLAAVFAARNEAMMVERATRSLLAQDYPELAVIAVDDRSTDATGAILDAMAAADRRLTVVHVVNLPVGWLGKTHALQAAAETCEAQWLLFTDADILFAPETLRRALALAERTAVDHLAVVPDVITESFGERIFLAMFLLLFNAYSPPRKVGNFRSKVSAGVGAFNLVRAGPFRAIGGFRRLALSVDEDMRLGQALKFAGYRSAIVLGKGMVSVRWQVGLGGMIRGLEKNFFAGAEYRLVNVALAACGLLVIGVAPHLAMLVGPWWTRLTATSGVGAIAVILALMRRPGNVAWYHAFVLPLGALACLVALVRSAALAVRRREIRWRDHHYPLDELRAHVRLRDQWTREVWRSTR